jgi:thymidylate kinase
MRGKFITIHGIDGTGKTTTAELLGAGLDESGIRIAPWKVVRDKLGPVPNSRASLAAGIGKKVSESTVVSGLMEQGMTLVRDRWAIDVMADHAFAGTPMRGCEASLATNPELLLPDFSVILVCKEDERMRRINLRGNPSEEDLIPNMPGSRAYFFQQYLLANIDKYSGNNMVIDTTDITPEDATGMIMRKLLNDGI